MLGPQNRKVDDAYSSILREVRIKGAKPAPAKKEEPAKEPAKKPKP